MKDYPYERYLRDARILPIFEVCVFWLRSHGPFILSKQPLETPGYLVSQPLDDMEPAIGCII